MASPRSSKSTTLAMNSACVTTITAVSVVLLLLSQIYFSHALQFAGWGKPCKTGADGSIVKPHEECEQSKGMQCQRWEQGEFCGCQIGGVLTYDRIAGECRRKIGSLCQKSSTPEEEAALPFNHRCHERAECVELNATATSTSSSRQLCLCKNGYYATSNLEECVSKSVATTTAVGLSVASVVSAMSVSLLLLLANVVR